MSVSISNFCARISIKKPIVIILLILLTYISGPRVKTGDFKDCWKKDEVDHFWPFPFSDNPADWDTTGMLYNEIIENRQNVFELGKRVCTLKININQNSI